MTDHLVIDGMQPWDGRYELGDTFGDFLTSLTTREWGWIKRLTGYMPLTITDGFAGADPELLAILAIITLRRNGRVETGDVPDVYDRIGDQPFGTKIRLEIGDTGEDDDARPPSASSGSSSDGSGANGSRSSETSDATPPATGTLASATSASDRVTSAS